MVNAVLTVGRQGWGMRLVFLAAVAILLPAAAQEPEPKAPPPAKPAISPIPQAEVCRTACAQRYYFCLAEGEADLCSAAWAQCLTVCGSAGRR